MHTMDTSNQAVMRHQLIQRRERLNNAIAETPDTMRLVNLLQEVESALKRIDAGSYGICEICNEPIDDEHLRWDPLVKVCLSHLSEAQQRAIERDLDLASQIQTTLLPARNTRLNGWEISYEYMPAGVVSGDYCDIVKSEIDPGILYFFLGDVSGKGVAASLLMSHLHAIFRSLVAGDLSLGQMTVRANRLFYDSTMAAHFATLICGQASANGKVDICNAGHCPPMLLRNRTITPLESTGLPVGLFANGEYRVETIAMKRGDSLVLYTDGLTEVRNMSDVEYGVGRLNEVMIRHDTLAPEGLTAALTQDAEAFRSGAPRADDLTVMVLQRRA